MLNDEELDKLQESLIEEELDEEQTKDRMKIDNRSIFTVRDEIIKKSEEEKD